MPEKCPKTESSFFCCDDCDNCIHIFDFHFCGTL